MVGVQHIREPILLWVCGERVHVHEFRQRDREQLLRAVHSAVVVDPRPDLVAPSFGVESDG